MSKNELQKHHVVHQLYHKCFELWTLSTSTVFFLFISFFKEYHSLPEEYRCWRMCSILAITEIFNGLQWMEFSWGHCSNRWPPLFHNVNQDEIYANETSGLYFISNSAEKIGLLAGITFDIFTITVYLRCNTLISNETNRNVNGVRKKLIFKLMLIEIWDSKYYTAPVSWVGLSSWFSAINSFLFFILIQPCNDWLAEWITFN